LGSFSTAGNPKPLGTGTLQSFPIRGPQGNTHPAEAFSQKANKAVFLHEKQTVEILLERRENKNCAAASGIVRHTKYPTPPRVTYWRHP